MILLPCVVHNKDDNLCGGKNKGKINEDRVPKFTGTNESESNLRIKILPMIVMKWKTMKVKIFAYFNIPLQSVSQITLWKPFHIPSDP